jgi:hypothetical protein
MKEKNRRPIIAILSLSLSRTLVSKDPPIGCVYNRTSGCELEQVLGFLHAFFQGLFSAFSLRRLETLERVEAKNSQQITKRSKLTLISRAFLYLARLMKYTTMLCKIPMIPMTWVVKEKQAHKTERSCLMLVHSAN